MSRHSYRIVPHRPVVLNLLNKIDQICTRSWIVISWKWIIFLLVRRKVFYIHLPFYLFDWLMLHISSLLLYAALFGVRRIFVSNLLSAPSIGPYIIGSSTLIALSSSILNFWLFDQDTESQDWEDPKPFHEGERISYCINMWSFYLQTTRFNNKKRKKLSFFLYRFLGRFPGREYVFFYFLPCFLLQILTSGSRKE